MKQVACHWLYASAEVCHPQAVVAVREDGTLSHWFPLQEEVCATQWLGGVIVLSPFASLSIGSEEDFMAFLRRVSLPSEGPRYAWHITDFDLMQRAFTPASRLCRL